MADANANNDGARMDFDLARFSQWLTSEFGEGETAIERISGGQSNLGKVLRRELRDEVIARPPG